MIKSTDLTNRDKLLPSHPVMRQLFQGDEASFWRRLEEVTSSVLPVSSVHDWLTIRLKPGVSYETYGSDLPTLFHLRLLVQAMRCQRVLEIGTYVGVSAMVMASAMPAGGRLTTIEIGAEFAALARENFLLNGFRDRIELIEGDANDVLVALAVLHARFDLIFLDGSKQDYASMLPCLLELLRPGGLLFVDNVFLHGDTLNLEPTTDKGKGVRDLLAAVARLDMPKTLIPAGDGHLLVMKP